ncbi:carbohydrate kinase family protein [Gaetbulibacter aestuarii]|uniref:Carbohydrate kinase n=1 Tax=Gaetbulibacter aestuarii TaxID=1502358 RepID=A0ABW7MXQ5_9FLAO
MSSIVCFGEVLWDVFPNQKKIGGAPLNVAIRASQFKNDVSMISAVGEDESGLTILNYLKQHGVNTEAIQILDAFKTGKVQVKLNNKGSATYTISYPGAWDKIEISEASKKLVKASDAFIFGSLATRDSVSKQTLYNLLDHAKFKVLDLNLRPPHYTIETLLSLMDKADFIKLNDEELYEVSDFLGSKFNGLEQNLKFIAEKTNTKQLCVTKGPFGAVLLKNDSLCYNSGYKVKVADTVGAGDSFLGTLISKLVENEEPQKALDMACAVGALVAQSEGANPEISIETIQNFMYP